MSLKREYTKSTVGKMKGGPGGWGCDCCNPYGCHPRNMKALARRRVRRVGRMELQEAIRVDMVGEDQVADQVYEVDRYHQELAYQNQEDTWQEINDYERRTGLKFVSAAHYYQHVDYLDWKSEFSLEG